MMLLGISGYFVALNSISLGIIVIFTNLVGLGLRVVYRPLRAMNQKTNMSKGMIRITPK
jgi:hypothetical protein